MTHDNPFVIRMNIDRFRSLLRAEADERKRRTIHQLLAEFEESAVEASHVPIRATLPPTPSTPRPLQPNQPGDPFRFNSSSTSRAASQWGPPEPCRPGPDLSRSGPQ
jgi:hypothetical protein